VPAPNLRRGPLCALEPLVHDHGRPRVRHSRHPPFRPGLIVVGVALAHADDGIGPDAKPLASETKQCLFLRQAILPIRGGFGIRQGFHVTQGPYRPAARNRAGGDEQDLALDRGEFTLHFLQPPSRRGLGPATPTEHHDPDQQQAEQWQEPEDGTGVSSSSDGHGNLQRLFNAASHRSPKMQYLGGAAAVSHRNAIPAGLRAKCTIPGHISSSAAGPPR
jgi:hypothetical protein